MKEIKATDIIELNKAYNNLKKAKNTFRKEESFRRLENAINDIAIRFIEQIEAEHNECNKCKYSDKEYYEEPCVRCSRAYLSKWEAKEE